MRFRRFVKQAMYGLVKTGLGAGILRWTAARASFLIPAERLLETDSLLAFYHPAPSYPLHILIVPKRGYSSLADLPSRDLEFEKDLFGAVRQLVERFSLDAGSYRLIVNGGEAQEVNHLHFHLISEDIPGRPG